ELEQQPTERLDLFRVPVGNEPREAAHPDLVQVGELLPPGVGEGDEAGPAIARIDGERDLIGRFERPNLPRDRRLMDVQRGGDLGWPNPPGPRNHPEDGQRAGGAAPSRAFDAATDPGEDARHLRDVFAGWLHGVHPITTSCVTQANSYRGSTAGQA